VAGIVGMGVAAREALAKMAAEQTRLAALRDTLESTILSRVPGTARNGVAEPRVANTTNISFDRVEAESLLIALDLEGIAVSTGNPHFVITADGADFTVAGDAWEKIGAEICKHPDFPNQTNVEFIRVLSRSEIEIRIFERGVGPTSSSGTGTSASATAAIAFHNCASPLQVVAPGGAQIVVWKGIGSELELTGPATLIARGEAWLK